MDISKSGFKTTEFWLAVATIAAGTLVIMGKLDTYNYPMATDIISKTLESVTVIVAQSVIIYKYLHMRHDLKNNIHEAQKEGKKIVLEVSPDQLKQLQEVVPELNIETHLETEAKIEIKKDT